LKRRRGGAAAESSFVEKFGFARARDFIAERPRCLTS